MRDQYWGSEEEEKKQEPISIHEALKERQNASSDDFNTVNVIDNKIYFYSGVSRPKVLKLNQSIVSLNRNFAKSQVMGYSTPPIKVHINSYGGSVFAGLAAVDYIKSSKANVESSFYFLSDSPPQSQ